MTAPQTTLYQMQYRNPHASEPLTLPVLVLCNTSDEDLEANIRRNSILDLNWIGFNPAHDNLAVMVGGGPSLADSIAQIKELVRKGAVIFAMNGASLYLTERNIPVHYQVIADAKPETASLVDPDAEQHLIASQVAPITMDTAGPFKRLWHLAISEDMDRLFPEERRRKGGYALVGGGAAVGNSALALAYVLGFRRFEVFGYDSSHRGDKSHAYRQAMNDFIPTIDVEWANETYTASVAMKAQAEKFQITGQALKQAGCTIRVHGDGLLPAMWNTPTDQLAEKDKYRLMWSVEAYRNCSPGEACVQQIMEQMKPDSLVIDYGCGTGRASIALAQRNVPVLLVDFADNCRDEEAMSLPFLEWDLSKPLPCASNYGICCDVMEHVPTEQVDAVLTNIMGASRSVFFQISTVHDGFGEMIGKSLHLTVRPPSWWIAKFQQLGFGIKWQESDADSVRLIATAHPSEG